MLLPRKLLSLAPAALVAGLAGCAAPPAPAHAISIPAPITNAASAPAPAAEPAAEPAGASPMCDSDTGRPLPGNVRNGDLGCPAHPEPALGATRADAPMLGSDGRPLPGNVGGGKALPERR